MPKIFSQLLWQVFLAPSITWKWKRCSHRYYFLWRLFPSLQRSSGCLQFQTWRMAPGAIPFWMFLARIALAYGKLRLIHRREDWHSRSLSHLPFSHLQKPKAPHATNENVNESVFPFNYSFLKKSKQSNNVLTSWISDYFFPPNIVRLSESLLVKTLASHTEGWEFNPR